MEWLQYLIIAYCTVSYTFGALIAVWYFLGGIVLHRTKANAPYWPYFLLCLLLSPIFVPWWIVTFARANKGG